MKKFYTLFMGLAAISCAGSASAQDLRIETNASNPDVEIIEQGKFDILNSLVSNTGGDTKICLGEVDFGDGDVYKAASIDFANGWGTDGWAILHAGADFESSMPFTEIPLNEYKSYYIPRRFGANMGFNVNGGVSEGIIMGDTGGLQYTKPTGKQKVYLTFFGGNGNIFAINFYKNEFVEEDFINDEDGDWGGDPGIRLRWPSEDPRYADKRVTVSVYDSTPAVPVGEGTDFPEARIDEKTNDEGIVTDNNGWGWTGAGFMVDYGTVDFGNNRFDQMMVEVNHYSQNLTDYLEIYIDEVNEANMIGNIWVGRELRDVMYPLALDIKPVSGSHKVIVKWIGGGINVRDIAFYEGHPWTPASECGAKLVDQTPYEDDAVFHFGFEGLTDGVGGPWIAEIKAKGRWEGKGNAGYTENGTVMSFYSETGEPLFTEDIFKTIVINHASEPAAVGLSDECYFAFYTDLDPEMIYVEDDWKSNLDMILEGKEPVAVVPMQGTLSWNTIKHTRGNVTGSLAGCTELFMVYNGAGANVFDLYFEPEREQSGINSVAAENGVTVCAEAGSIVVNAVSATQVAVYGLNGVVVVNTAVAAGSHTFAVAPGFYVVKTVDAAGAAAAKVIVK